MATQERARVLSAATLKRLKEAEEKKAGGAELTMKPKRRVVSLKVMKEG